MNIIFGKYGGSETEGDYFFVNIVFPSEKPLSLYSKILSSIDTARFVKNGDLKNMKKTLKGYYNRNSTKERN